MMRRCRTYLQQIPGITEPPPMESIKLEVISPSLLYRRLLKLYLRKFDTDHQTIIRAWKQTKYEFYFHRETPVSERELCIIKGQQVYEAIRAGIVPIYRDAKSGQMFYKYDKDTLAANHNQLDPITAEEFVRRYADKIPKNELEEIRANLKGVGRWVGPDEFSEKDLHRIKHKRKRRRVKCTDPDPELEDAAAAAAAAETQSAAATSSTAPLAQEVGKL